MDYYGTEKRRKELAQFNSYADRQSSICNVCRFFGTDRPNNTFICIVISHSIFIVMLAYIIMFI